jgi:hypothetical protein
VTRPVSVDELVRAHHAVLAGQFRRHRTPSLHSVWDPAGPVLPVLGAGGGTGATTVALALATAAGAGRVVECAPPGASGLTAAPTAELGAHPSGWVRGSRDVVLVERVAQPVLSPGQVPVPSPPRVEPVLTVVDVGWDLRAVQAASSWLTDLVAAAPVLVLTTSATIPGLRRLETTLALLPPAQQAVAAVLGPPRRKWPRALIASAGPGTHALLRADRVAQVPFDATLATRGIDTAALPTALLAAAGRLLALTTDTISPSGRDLQP